MNVGISAADLDRLHKGGKPKGGLKTVPLSSPRSALPKETFQQAAQAARARIRSQVSSRLTDVPPSSTPPAPIKDDPNAELLAKCLDGSESGAYGHYINRYAFCLSQRVTVRYYVIHSDAPPEYHATTRFTYQLFAQGDNHYRHIRVWGRMKQGSADYDWPWWDDLWQTPKIVQLSMSGECDGAELECSGTSGTVTLPFNVWDHDPAWYHFDIADSSDTYGSAQGRDKIAYHRWFLQFTSQGEGYSTLVPGRGAATRMRCDSATYISAGQQSSCLFSDSLPVLNYYATPGSPTEMVAKHIGDAQYHPETTYPLTAPPGTPNPPAKQIPGGVLNAPLHRIKNTDAGWKDNQRHKDMACTDTGDYKGLGLPPDKRPDKTKQEQCDEYPFRATLEGAANPNWDFSVRAVPRSDNASAGSRLKLYYLHERILSWDPTLPDPADSNDWYWVNINY